MSEEKIAWIRKSLSRGDLKHIHARLDGVKYETVRAIIKGAFFGKYGEEVINAAMDFISIKLKKAELERKQIKRLRNRHRN